MAQLNVVGGWRRADATEGRYEFARGRAESAVVEESTMVSISATYMLQYREHA